MREAVFSARDSRSRIWFKALVVQGVVCLCAGGVPWAGLAEEMTRPRDPVSQRTQTEGCKISA